MFCSKYQKISIFLPIWLSTVINQIVNKVKKNRIKTTPPYESHFLYLTKKRHIQTQARQDKAWQGMTRQGQARPDEARRGGAQTRRCPLVLKNTVHNHHQLFQTFSVWVQDVANPAPPVQTGTLVSKCMISSFLRSMAHDGPWWKIIPTKQVKINNKVIFNLCTCRVYWC